MTLRVAFESAVRAAAVSLLTDFAASAGIKLQVYRARPASLFPPTAFVDKMGERIEYPGSTDWRQRTVTAEVVVVHGVFDSGEAVDQRDAFVDAFLDWATDRVHEAGASTTLGLVAVEDEPAWSPDWNPVNGNASAVYYATRLTLEGFAGG